MEGDSDHALLPPIEEERGDDPEVMSSRIDFLEEKPEVYEEEGDFSDFVEDSSVHESESENKFEMIEENESELRTETDEEYEEDGEFLDNTSILEGSIQSELLPVVIETEEKHDSGMIVEKHDSDIKDDMEVDESTILHDEKEADKDFGIGDENIHENENGSILFKENRAKSTSFSNTPSIIDRESEETSLSSRDGTESVNDILNELVSTSVGSIKNKSSFNIEHDDEKVYYSSMEILTSKRKTSHEPLRKSESSTRKMSGTVHSIVPDILDDIIQNTFQLSEEKLLGDNYFRSVDSIRIMKLQRKIESEKIKAARILRKQQTRAGKSSLSKIFSWKSEEAKLIAEIESLLNKRKRLIIERATLKPFTLVDSYGYNSNLGVHCTNIKGKAHICFACSHSCMVYSVEKKKGILLQGHRNMVSTFNGDRSGNWVATADEGLDSSIVIWDVLNGFPVHTIFSPYPQGTLRLAFSCNNQYLLTISAGDEQIIAIWKWSKGSTAPEATCILPHDCSTIERLDADPANPNYSICTYKEGVVFISFREDENVLKQHSPKDKSMLSQTYGKFTSSTYILRTHLALTATNKGYIVFWSDVSFEKSFKLEEQATNDKEAIEVMMLKDCSIEDITCIQDRRRLIVTADSQGYISFYDITMKLLFWSEQHANQPIKFIEFLPQRIKRRKIPILEQDTLLDKNSTTTSTRRKCDRPRDFQRFFSLTRPYILQTFFIVTVNGEILKVNSSNNDLEIIIPARIEPFTAMVCHTEKNLLYIGTQNGMVYLYDFKKRSCLLTATVKEDCRVQNGKYSITSIGIGNLGLELAIGLEDGSLHFYDSVLLTKQEHTFSNSKTAIRNIVFDKECNYLAHSDGENSISLYIVGGKKILLGRYQAHYANISYLVFTEKNYTLVSISEDGKLATYSIENNGDDIRIQVSDTIDERAIPLTVAPYYKPGGTILKEKHEEFVLISTSKFKFKVFSTLTRDCVKTLQAPCHSTPVRFIKMLHPDYMNGERNPKYFVYATDNEIGLQALPVDGNPFKSLAVVGSPTKIQEIEVSPDNQYLFTFGRNDNSLLIWKIDQLAVQLSSYYGGVGLQPFYSMVEGGRSGWLMNEIRNYFYYFQLVHVGELMMGRREVDDTIHLCDLFNFLNAIGYFPSNAEKSLIYNEVKRNHKESDEKILLEFDYVVQLYLNHKPASGVQESELRDAFNTLAQHLETSPNSFTDSIDKTALLECLQERGDKFTTQEMSIILSTLAIGKKDSGVDVSDTSEDQNYEYNYLPDEISYTYFLKELMGLEIKNQEESHANGNT